MTVLCVDDDPDDRLLLCEAINEINASIHCIGVCNGQEALNFLSSRMIPDIIFMDLYMPVMNGIDCLSQIRSNQNFNEIKIIMTSTLSNPINDKRIKNLGAEFMLKPNTYAEFISNLNTTLFP